jgi:hypothetical protein
MIGFMARCLSATLLWLCASEARAADIDVYTKHLTTIRLTGLFRQGDSSAMRHLLTQLPAMPGAPLATVE